MKPKIPHPLRDPVSNLCDIIKFGFFHQLRLLINTGINLECRDSNRRNPIILCAFMEPEAWGVGIARILIENNVRLDKTDKYGRNAFHYACIYERVGLIQVLLKAMDFDLNQTDKLGNTALHYAALTGNIVVSQIVARAFNRYRISRDKTNKHGFTAAQEALRSGNSKCGHVIEQEIMERRPGSAIKDVRFADQISFEELQHQQASHKVQRSAFITSSFSQNSGRVRQLRPWSCSALNRQNSSLSSLSTVEDHASSNSFRSRSNLSFRGLCSTKKSNKTLVAMGIRRDDEVSHCIQADDFRNKPDFIFKLVHLHYDANDWHPVLGQEATNHSPPWNDTCNGVNKSHALIATSDWRHELKSLFKVYESQCSASWRAALNNKANEEQEKLAAELAEEEEKNKKSRRLSHHNKSGITNKEPAPEMKRRMSTTRMRRRSSIHGLLGKIPSGATSSMDGSLNTSTESINSLGMTGKRRGSDNNNNNNKDSNMSSTLQRSEVIPNRTGLNRRSSKDRPASPSHVTKNNNQVSNSSSHITKNHTKQTKDHNSKQIIETEPPSSDAALFSNNNENVNNNITENKLRQCPSKHETRDIQQNRFTNCRQNNNNNIKNRGQTMNSCKLMSIPQVKECLVDDVVLYDNSNNNDDNNDDGGVNNVVITKPDTTRLWVQNPYIDVNDDDDFNDDEGDCVEYVDVSEFENDSVLDG